MPFPLYKIPYSQVSLPALDAASNSLNCIYGKIQAASMSIGIIPGDP